MFFQLTIKKTEQLQDFMTGNMMGIEALSN